MQFDLTLGPSRSSSSLSSSAISSSLCSLKQSEASETDSDNPSLSTRFESASRLLASVSSYSIYCAKNSF